MIEIQCHIGPALCLSRKFNWLSSFLILKLAVFGNAGVIYGLPLLAVIEFCACLVIVIKFGTEVLIVAHYAVG